RVLGMSSDSAWRRMHAASLADRFPDVVKPLIAERKVHLTGLALLDKVITPENGERLIQEAAGKSTSEIKAIIAREQPEECVAGLRKLPPRQVTESTWRFQAEMTTETKELLTRVQDMASEDDCNVILRDALAALHEALRVKKQKGLKRAERSAASMQRAHDPRERRIPRWMERSVRERDGHRCTFVGIGGRCTARRALHVHHILAVALGGKTELSNLTLHCAAHNNYQAELDLGVERANRWRKRRSANSRAGPPARRVGT
ncbi:MAG TPA: HNH endonuclease signature motif containing protein, partial [Myxococcota bacterium]|nr:HNH endonuclease signature motif containing protein [Myxococcota bacterium]